VTDHGLAAVMLGAKEAALEETLAAEYPAATKTRDDGGLAGWVAAVLATIDAHPRGSAVPHLAAGSDLPLDLNGTAFEMRVWRALREIPPGSTRTYGEIAAALGKPGAARAVGRACAANRLAVVIPCHRVVRAGGDAGGYRWGAATKRRLLALESASDEATPPTPPLAGRRRSRKS
jgi:AraC family transcriptional regulator of adaptative response/methylated-DNA-[protein]-cysteine methyltransferase